MNTKTNAKSPVMTLSCPACGDAALYIDTVSDGYTDSTSTVISCDSCGQRLSIY